MLTDKEDEIRKHAYHLWLKEGKPEGRHVEHWHKASAEIEKNSQNKPSKNKAAEMNDYSEDTPKKKLKVKK